MLKVGWTTLSEEWNGVFWHDATKSLLIAYVDDFKLAASAKLHGKLWKGIKSVIDMDDETTDGRFLGCVHERYVTTVSKVRELLENQPQHHPRSLGNEAHNGGPNLDARASGCNAGNMAPQRVGHIVQHVRVRQRLRSSIL